MGRGPLIRPADARKLLRGLAVGVLLLLTAAQSIGQSSSIRGTPHDFSTRGWGSNQICIFCHTPHNAASASAPLWNRPGMDQPYQVYRNTLSPTLRVSAAQPEGVSRLCLSCHDGMMALDAFGTRVGAVFLAGPGNLTHDLRNDHPVSFAYDTALVTADASKGPHLVTPENKNQVAPGIPLFNGKVECATCHNPHNNINGAFLRISNAGSQLCLRCHRM